MELIREVLKKENGVQNETFETNNKKLLPLNYSQIYFNVEK
jgi:hypothetical protein